ncbi:hypothetical protein, phage-associated [Candidatus Phytoplasma mali]|uniref:Antitoxin SocA-like Panacea domain-containing protein n=1 Tax=Phytoplasma mali (strain AT) TaxID=482235 RepID=B3QZR0_PHYMT|nr:type II toxin-antitoxin system antitoxin SocA domain-containing protein [Candidatus Phytoplasma mali]CAP18447.1 hypothetical protein, phage-associated [Candidatus Phytoplasma mali]
MENKNQFNIFDIGKYLLENCRKKYGTGITQLQKLLYYAQAEYLVCYNQPLFLEEIHAWDFGPIVPSVYFEFIRYLAESKDIFKYKCSKHPLPSKVIKILNLVLEKNGNKDSRTLTAQTRNEAPWKTTYYPNKKISIAIISTAKIYNFFKNNSLKHLK